MAEQSPQHVVNNDMSTGAVLPVDAHASHTELPSAVQGATQSHHQHPLSDSTEPLSKPSSDHSHQNGIIDREQDNATPDPHGSDTDSSRPDGSKTARSGSSKKPLSFKPVSITKSFLAKTATTTGPVAPVAKVSEKASPQLTTLQPFAKPRLIAKTGSSGLRDLPRTHSGDGTNTPNGRTVWNKNQPTPAPPPKQFTDEELKLQYGIHLATRLESDESTQKAKWADIDEDEDDWAPETVEWMDGTKTTISHADAVTPQPEEKPVVKSLEEQQEQPLQPQQQQQQQQQPQQQPQQQQQQQQQQQPPAPSKPVMTALKRPGVVAPTRTILRPGASQQAKQVGADGKATPNGSSPVTKSSSVAPVKSPWAQLPPVERVSPVVVNPPAIAPPPPKFTNRDPHGFDAPGSQPLPAREMATDTFDRSWKEGERTNRELFNSQSGRYEPAPEYRRGSRQQDAHRQPAVLQRPSPQPGPAEPSAAFQARANSQSESSPWARRRGSSISGNVMRDRRMSSSSKVFEASPEVTAAVPAVAQATIQTPETQMDQTDGTAPSVLSVAEEREKQKKLMQEKREAAIRRKQEEEAREEAEKKERIRKRMEALGMSLEKTPPSQEKPDKPQQPESQQDHEQQTTNANSAPATKQPPQKAPAVQPVELSANETPCLEQQSRPDVQSHAKQQLSPVKERTVDHSPPFAQNSTPVARPAPNSLSSLSSPQLPGLQQHSPNGPTRSSYQQSSFQGMTSSSFSSPGDQKAQPARMPSISGGDAFAPSLWSNGGMATHTAPGANVWGPPPTNNRHIGNGTFDAGYSSISPGSRQQQNAPFSGPFARAYTQRISPKTFGPPGSAAPGSVDQSYGSLATSDSRMGEPSGASALAGTSPLPEPARLAYPAPIAPPQKTMSRAQPSSQRDTSAWTTFANNAQAKEEAEATRLAAERKGHSSPQQQHRWTETFKQTRVGDERWLNGTRTTLNQERTTYGDGLSPHKPGVIGSGPQSPMAHQAISTQPQTGDHLHASGAGIVRLPTGGSSNLSKNFSSGDIVTDVRLPPLTAYSGNVQPLPLQPPTPGSTPQQSRFFPLAMYGGSPPPEESDHPVYSGDTRHPQVNLPQPKPTVKLPPSSRADHEQASPVTMPRSVHSYTVGARPLVQTLDWQARFNGLFGRAQAQAQAQTTPPSPPKTPPKMQAPAPAVASISRMSSHLVVAQSDTNVSLPRPAASTSSATNVISKPGVDDIFDGELSFGSTPKVCVPRGVKYPEPPVSTQGSTPLRPNSKFHKFVETQSTAIFWFPTNQSHDITVRILLPFSQADAKSATLPGKFSHGSKLQARKNTNRANNKIKRNGSSSNVLDSTSSTSQAITTKGEGDKGQGSVSTNDVMTEPHSAARSGPANADGPSKRNAWPKPPRGGGAGYKART